MVLVLALIIGGIAALPFLIEARRRPVERIAPNSQFVHLSQGITHYQWIGPTRGPVIVAIHGLTAPGLGLTAIAEQVALLGYRVLIYDLYGRGQSDAVPGAQDRAFFQTQLKDLLVDQGLTENLTLMGYSMGGMIATAFAADNPDKVTRVILLAPAGIKSNLAKGQAFVTRVPVLGDWLFHMVGAGAMRRDLINRVAGDGEVPGLQAAQIAQFGRKGFVPAVLSSIRGFLSDRQEADHRKLGHDGIPVVGIWGEADATIPLSALGQLTQWNRAVRQETVKGAGHGLPYTHATAVAKILRSVLAERD